MRYPIYLFAKGDEYKLWGLIPGNIHLWGLRTEEGKILPVFLLGSDSIGHDVLSRIFFGGRISLTVGLIGIFLAFVLGLVLGGIAGFFGGTVDEIIMRVIDVLISLPTIPLWMSLAAALPQDWPQLRMYFYVTIILSILGWTTLARTVRGKMLSLREEDYVMSARLDGESDASIIARYMLPGFASYIIVSSNPVDPRNDPGRDCPQLLGAWPACTDHFLGGDAPGCAEPAGGGATPLAVVALRLCHPGRADVQFPGRWAARCGRSLRNLNRWLMPENPPLIEVKDLHTYFHLAEGVVHAVDGVDLTIRQKQTMGIVGESGCGKSITGFSMLRLITPPGKIESGEILFYKPERADRGTARTEVINITQLDPGGKEIRDIRGNQISMVFQEPMTAMSPVRTVGQQITEAIILHQKLSKAEAREKAIEMLARVKMSRPERVIDDYPFQLSGGMRQRAVIAMALSCKPNLLIADEPTTALDVTTEAQILKLMRELQEEFGMAIMYITHNLGVIAEMAEDVAVMYMGQRGRTDRCEIDLLQPSAPIHAWIIVFYSFFIGCCRRRASD